MADESRSLWDIDEGIHDPGRFFAILPSTFPTATLLFVEGGSIVPDVAACYRRFADPGPYVPNRQTIWPRSALYRCSASAQLFAALSALSEDHPAAEMLDHLSLYEGDRPLLEWHDAFANAILIDGAVSEATVSRLAHEFGCRYGRATFGAP